LTGCAKFGPVFSPGRSPKLAAFVALAGPLDLLARVPRAAPHPYPGLVCLGKTL
jgi:hypothetical protein